MSWGALIWKTEKTGFSIGRCPHLIGGEFGEFLGWGALIFSEGAGKELDKALLDPREIPLK